MNNTLPKLNKPSAKPTAIKSACVFCASSMGTSPLYAEEATSGGSVGLMGATAKAVLDNGGQALSVVPEPLFKHGSKQLCETIIVPDMHSRKKRMADESDAFIVLPGGFGTMEEMLEMITWSQLNIHSKPIILLNTKNFFDLYIQWIQLAAKEQFIPEKNVNIFVTCETTESVLDKLINYIAPETRYGLDWTNANHRVAALTE
ncbi:hypothetical protein RO3G_08957 [Rhizopus delemar RA 99-880]|uniref:Cytokinin riboside 5'-monophosphate phosphoribohydrolase n=1 Tax=Rhizopus delemar (strain RA 99-880 / ATCC MYA-4621 / FGSC 9543 / NRRL 43880) TaxID=246409 RepID=I1C717_RHIO9|nr:hypothetical protein RO3G_08957 [Rhizopus delemar RA 99-880]|eukprot:EIE84247.1 hypothetical protein RO3G_08957 [Rhizopus delemar RA 99-880]